MHAESNVMSVWQVSVHHRGKHMQSEHAEGSLLQGYQVLPKLQGTMNKVL